jgi:superoxide dismutase, Fe-Mn family
MKKILYLLLLASAFGLGLYVEKIYDILHPFTLASIKHAEIKHPENIILSDLTYPYKLPDLAYTYSALEPYIDAETMITHHTKHHRAYVDNLNKALVEYPVFQKKSLVWLLTHLQELPENLRKSVENHGGGHFNHSLFWQLMRPAISPSPKGAHETVDLKALQNNNGPVGKLSEEITKTFGSFEKFKTDFEKTAQTVFGSGWAWLCLDAQKRLVITSTSNQDTPFEQDFLPVLGFDVWEHAYYLKYKNKRADYALAWWHVVNWERADELYAQALTQE